MTTLTKCIHCDACQTLWCMSNTETGSKAQINSCRFSASCLSPSFVLFYICAILCPICLLSADRVGLRGVSSALSYLSTYNDAEVLERRATGEKSQEKLLSHDALQLLRWEKQQWVQHHMTCHTLLFTHLAFVRMMTSHWEGAKFYLGLDRLSVDIKENGACDYWIVRK